MAANRRLPVLVLSAAMLTSLVGPVLAADGGLVANGGEAEPTAAEADAIRFRETFGLQAGTAFVRATFANDVDFSADAYGVPLSTAEVAELFRRARIETALPEALEIARAEVGFGGVYLDQRRGGRPVFLFTAVAATIEGRLASVLPVGADVEVRQVLRTEVELAGLKERVEGDRSEWEARGLPILRVAIDTRANGLRIGVAHETAAYSASLRAAYGDDLVVFEATAAHSDACDGTNNCRPMKGGIAINPTGQLPGKCTAGFVVRRTDTSALAILTAGHCIDRWGGFDQAWQHNSQGFGRALHETWKVGGVGDADVGLITIQSPEVALMTNKNEMRRTNGSVASVTGHTVGHPAQGAQACRVGYASGHDCGVVEFSDVGHWSPVENWGSMWVSHTVQVNFDSAAGDSGGPIFRYPGGGQCCNPVWAMGVHVHSLDPEDFTGWYSPITRGIADYDALPAPINYTFALCLTPSCVPPPE